MPRIVHRRMLPLLVLLSQMSLGPGLAAASARGRPEVGQQRAPSAALEALEIWLQSVEEHQPGVRDAALARVSRWSGWDLGALWVGGIEPLLRACDRQARQQSLAGIPTVRPLRGPNDAERAFVRGLARGLIRRGAVDRVLRGGAILHGDAAMMALPDPETGEWAPDASPRQRRPSGSGSGVSALADGTHAFAPDTAAAHWPMARLLFDQVRTDPSDREPSPARDPVVHSWYRASLAVMAAIPYVDTAHFDRAAELFADDPAVHLLIGSLHEWVAGDPVQHAIAIAESGPRREPGGQPRTAPRFRVGSRQDELGSARRHLERAVGLDATLTEARVRLGRVLGLLGDHRGAAAQLREAVAAAPEPLLVYYANLFLGAEEEALGRLAEARDAYQQAGSLYPQASTPPLALSHLARRQGNRDEALRLIGRVLAPRPGAPAAVDPMRGYARAAGRHAKSMLREAVRLSIEWAPATGNRVTDPVQ